MMFRIEFDIEFDRQHQTIPLMSIFSQEDVIGLEADERSICPPTIHQIDAVRIAENVLGWICISSVVHMAAVPCTL